MQRNDIAMAITKYDQFDFLIDIVPRDDIKPTKAREDGTQRTGSNPDQVSFRYLNTYFSINETISLKFIFMNIIFLHTFFRFIIISN